MTGGDDEVALTPGWVTRVKCDFTAVLWASLVFFSLVFAASDWIWVRGGGVVGLEVQKSWLPLQSWWGKASFPFCSPLMRVFVSLSTLFFSRWLWSRSWLISYNLPPPSHATRTWNICSLGPFKILSRELSFSDRSCCCLADSGAPVGFSLVVGICRQ